jgi:hypothetical protein
MNASMLEQMVHDRHREAYTAAREARVVRALRAGRRADRAARNARLAADRAVPGAVAAAR